VFFSLLGTTRDARSLEFARHAKRKKKTPSSSSSLALEDDEEEEEEKQRCVHIEWEK